MTDLQLKQGADWPTLQKRSQLFQQLRAFFYERGVTEVDVPIFTPYATPDAHLDSVQAPFHLPGFTQPQKLYAHTSPEYTLKRLLAEGAGDLFYLGKVFRDGDLSPRHQPEFTLLEWYRLGFELKDLIVETVELCRQVLGEALPSETLTYQQLFQKVLGIADIHHASAETCYQTYQQHGLPEIVGVEKNDKILWEQLLLTEIIEPQLGRDAEGKRQITCVTEFPNHIASLAQPHPQKPWLVQRVEIYIDGMELANGYQELQQAEAYQTAFTKALAERQKMSKSPVLVDIALIETLQQHPLPRCSGIALGVDRLFMLQQSLTDIRSTLSFYLD